MKRFLLAAALLFATAAQAADNIQVTQGSGTPVRSTDTSAGATGAGPYVNWYTLSTSGAAGTAPVVLYGTAGAAAANPLTVQGIASMTPIQVSQSGAWTVSATQSGTWNLNTVTTVTNPVAVTESGTWTVQPGNTANTTPWLVTSRNVGNAGAITDFAGQNAASPANAWLIGAQFNTAPTTITSGNASPLQLDASGNLLVNVKAGGGSGGTSSTFGSAFPGTGTAVGFSDGTNMQPGRVTTYGTAPTGLNAIAVNAFVTNAATPGRAVSGSSSPVVPSAAPTTYHVIWPNNITGISVKGSAATLMSCQMSNNSTTPAYLKIYNKATAPTVGTDTPVKTLIIPGPAAGGGGSNPVFGSGGFSLSLGLGVGVSTGIADADTGVPAAGTYAINCDYD